mmetsp:Transcript_19947/g.66456  ORF Transcript_19947/g.66456 Transcript_19947/m.66456 type:complete len:214 (-) Transcript_19947:905-1546(-)
MRTWKHRSACSSTRSLPSCSSSSSIPLSSKRSRAFHPPASSKALNQPVSLLSIAALTSIRFFSVGSARIRRAAACGVISGFLSSISPNTKSSYLGKSTESFAPNLSSPSPSAESESVSSSSSSSSSSSPSSSSSSSLPRTSLQSSQSSSGSSPIGDFLGASTRDPNMIARRISSIPSMHTWITLTHSCRSLPVSHWKKKLLFPCAQSPRQFLV